MESKLIKYLVWALILPFEIVIGMIGRLLAPIVCLFIVKTPRFDVVKRLGKQKVLLENRYDLPSWLSWFGTFDNDMSEYWFGMYPLSEYFTQEQYDNSRLLRWFMAVCWLWRNSMYGFTRKYISVKADSWLAWHYKGQVSLPFNLQMHINIGWKAHKGFNDNILMYAGRPVGRITKQ
jgi:hypothetical protein